MILVIMAAGLGSRFGGLKQAEPVDDFENFLIDYSIFDAILAGFDKVVFILRQKNYNLFKSTIGKRAEKHICTEFVFQENDDILPLAPHLYFREKPFGTAHAIGKLKGKINENFAVINADDFYGKNSFLLLAENLKQLQGGQFCSVCFEAGKTLSPSGTVKRGVCKLDGENIMAIEECEIESLENHLNAKNLLNGHCFRISKNTPVSMNMFGFTPKIFDFIDREFSPFINKLKTDYYAEFFLPAVIESAIKQQKCNLKAVKSNEKWMGITYREDLLQVRKNIAKLKSQGIYPENLWKK